MGGSSGEPSCYQCHGKTWTDDSDDYANSHAPGNHTQLNGRFYHDPAHANAELVCGACHGVTLEGEGESGSPPCLLCHTDRWN